MKTVAADKSGVFGRQKYRFVCGNENVDLRFVTRTRLYVGTISLRLDEENIINIYREKIRQDVIGVFQNHQLS